MGMRTAWLVFGAACVACTEKQPAAQPEVIGRAPDAAASGAPVPAAIASASAPPAPLPVPELSPEAEKRVQRWKRATIDRVVKQYATTVPGYPADPASIQTENSRYGVFDVIAASIPTPVMAGGAEDTHEMLVITKQGQVALPNAPDVIGLGDMNGDGRPDLVLKDVTVVADMPNGPLVLKLGDKGGAYGWRTVRITTHEGKPALVATTETNTSREVGVMRSGGYMAQSSKGILEEVTLQWDGKRLAAVGRKPIETAADAEARQRGFAEDARKEEALRGR